MPNSDHWVSKFRWEKNFHPLLKSICVSKKIPVDCKKKYFSQPTEQLLTSASNFSADSAQKTPEKGEKLVYYR